VRTLLLEFRCASCGGVAEADRIQRRCSDCGGALLARYDLSRGAPGLRQVLGRPPGLLRVHELSPLRSHHFATLGEGATPLLPGEGLAVELDLPHLVIKDEGQNPSGSWECRGVSVATARARELGIGRISLCSAGDSARAAAAYGALQGLDVRLQIPDDSPASLLDELRGRGAELQLLPWAQIQQQDSAEHKNGDGWLDLSAMAEPFRLEGAKTLGFELIYDLGRVPDAIICPTGTGLAIAAIGKAFDEMEAMGWIAAVRPRLVAVQSDTFAPLVHAFRKHRDQVQAWTKASDSAPRELRCSSTQASALALDALRSSRGTAIAVPEREIAAGQRLLARRLGLAGSAATGAAVAAARALRQSGFLHREALVVAVSPSNGL
jgi:threonine synthase